MLNQVVTYIKGLGLSVRQWAYAAVFALISGLLIALKLKDEEMHSYQVKDMQEKFAKEKAVADAKVQEAKEKYEDTK